MKDIRKVPFWIIVVVGLYGCAALRTSDRSASVNEQSRGEVHALVQTHAYAVLEAYQEKDFERARQELASTLRILDRLPLQSRAEKIDYLDRHFPPRNRNLSYAIVADDLHWRAAAPAVPTEAVEPPADRSEDSTEAISGQAPPRPPGEVDTLPGETASLFSDRDTDAPTSAVIKPPGDSESYFDSDLHQFIQKEIKEIALHMGERENFKLPDDFVAEIEYYIRRFQNEPYYREFFQRTLRRSRKYVPALRKYFSEKGFPEEIIYLAFIESGFNPLAYSRSHAAGMFQFIKSTGRLYGLKINRSRDERYSPVKSAIACREYLHDLLLELGSFTLALSAYNSGAGKIRQALRQLDDFKERSFWALRQKTEVLKHETREYIPQIFAAIVMAKPGHPVRFGFPDVPFPDDSQYRIVIIPQPVKLQPLAEAGGVTVTDILALNPDLPSTAAGTPERVRDYPLFVPAASEAAIVATVEQLLERRRTSRDEGVSGNTSAETGRERTYHRIRRGETLSGIAGKYGVTVSELRRWNNLRGSKIVAGKSLVVQAPVSGAQLAKMRSVVKTSPEKSGAAGVVEEQNIAAGEPFKYAVAPNNTLSEIAELFGVRVSQLKQWNGLTSNRLRVGQKLTVISPRSMKFYKYRVQKGDILGDIARRFDARVATIKLVNGKRGNLIRVGEVLSIFSI